MTHYRIVPEQSQVLIDAKSSLHPIHTRTEGLDGHLDVEVLGAGRIDARRFPTIDGELTELRATGTDNRYVARGDLTFRGVTNTYEDEITITQVDDGTLRLEGAHTFDIRDFGMEPPRILMLRVEPDVSVRVEIIAEKED